MTTGYDEYFRAQQYGIWFRRVMAVRNDAEAFARIQRDAREALSVHLGRSSIPSNQE